MLEKWKSPDKNKQPLGMILTSYQKHLTHPLHEPPSSVQDNLLNRKQNNLHF